MTNLSYAYSKNLIVDADADKNYAENLSNAYGLTILENKPLENIGLVLTKNGLCLRNFAKKMPDLHFNYNDANFLRRMDSKRILHEAVLKACKLKHHKINFLIDGTFGAGIDSLILTKIADKILGYEKNFYTFLLAQDAIYRAKKQGILTAELEKIEVKFADCTTHLKSMVSCAEVIYLDFMFATDSKKSLAKKNMQFMRYMATEQNSANVLSIARTVAKRKVVLKRPLHSQSDKHITYSLFGKNIRFDVYQTNNCHEI